MFSLFSKPSPLCIRFFFFPFHFHSNCETSHIFTLSSYFALQCFYYVWKICFLSHVSYSFTCFPYVVLLSFGFFLFLVLSFPPSTIFILFPVCSQRHRVNAFLIQFLFLVYVCFCCLFFTTFCRCFWWRMFFFSFHYSNFFLM